MERSDIRLNERYGLYIGGSFVPAGSGSVTMTHCPADGTFLAETAAAGPEDVDRAVKTAREALAGWTAMSAADRSARLGRLADRIEAERDRLSAVEALDTGRPISETRLDVDAVADQFRYFAAAARSAEDSSVRHDRDSFSLLVREPLGAVGQIVPWNFPILIAAWKLAPALAAGNTVVIKPAGLTPLSLLELARLSLDILPPGVLNVVTGSGRTCGEAIITHPGIAKLAFTGSTEVGCRIAGAAAERVIPCSLELGGKSANIVFPDAPFEKAVEGAASAILYNMGQVCNAGSRLLLHRDIHDRVVERLVAIFGSLRFGMPLDETTQAGSLIDAGQVETFLRYVEIGRQDGARLVRGGSRRDDPGLERGFFVEPAIFTGVDNSMRIAREEVFGPLLSIIPFRDEAEAIRIANDTEYGLAGAVWTADIDRAFRVAGAIQAGTVWVNEYNLVPSGSPFGGYKKSGYGRDSHQSALDHYSQIKNIFVSRRSEPWGIYG